MFRQDVIYASIGVSNIRLNIKFGLTKVSPYRRKLLTIGESYLGYDQWTNALDAALFVSDFGRFSIVK